MSTRTPKGESGGVVGFFDWGAPLLRRYGNRWSAEDVQQVAEWLRPHAPEGGSILDLGGGAGGLAVGLADTLPVRVTVLDPSAAMVAGVPDHGGVDVVIGDAAAIPFDADAFDAVVVSDAFHHFRDQPAAAREMARVVRPGGAALVLEFDRANFVVKAVRLAEMLVGEPGYFMSVEEMCAFMAAHGIEGRCEPQRAGSFVFIGTVGGSI
jgi:demethylmenaquinone methyltransferase/2-methoxy-6-polyprenyl-1,4-benzoquinol methylase